MFQDLTGQKFGRLTVMRRGSDYVYANGTHRVRWVCICECGNEVCVFATNLKRSNTKSCGCLKAEERKRRSTTHNDRHSRLYSIWTNIKSRCYNPSTPNYSMYGGRGIRMCDEWREAYESFKHWAVSNGYHDGDSKSDCTIDRIDVNGNYSPDNCRWADAKEQANNRRNTVKVSAFHETHTLSEWAEITGIKYHTLFARIYRLGWSPEIALTNK